jgi:putrescine transport system substrate-binding protein
MEDLSALRCNICGQLAIAGTDRRTDVARRRAFVPSGAETPRLARLCQRLVNGDVCVRSAIRWIACAPATQPAWWKNSSRSTFSSQEVLGRLDNLVIPMDAPHVEEAYKFIDFLLQPEIAARNTNFIGVANGVLASKSLVDGSISRNKSIYPDAAMMKRLVAPQLDDGAPTTGQTISREGTPIGRGATMWGLGRRVSQPAKSPTF